MEILLTGSSGYLGKELYNELKLNSIKTLSRSNSIYNFDLSYQIPYFEISFDLVIHSAGKAHVVPKQNFDSISFHKINVLGTKNLLLGLSKFPPKQFVYISSVSVYGLIKGVNINESHPLLAKDPYGKSKIEAEEIVKNWCSEYNVNCTILRLPLVVGKNPPGNLGAMIRGIKNGYYFNIAGGKAKKSMVLASDIAKYVLKIADVGGTYNLTDGIHPTVNELSKSIFKYKGNFFLPNMPIFVAIVLAKIGDIIGFSPPINSIKLLKITSTLTFDDSKARESFDWNPSSVISNIRSNI
jgi:nucleoside-diphosphate-sugar epimerase